MTGTPEIRRQANGAINLDFYRMGAIVLRRQALHDGKTFRTACAGLLTMASALAVVLVIAAPTPASRALPSMAQAEAPQIW